MALSTYYTNIFNMGKITKADIPYRLNAIGLGDKYQADKTLLEMFCDYCNKLKADPTKWPKPITHEYEEAARLFYRQLDRKMHDMFMLLIHDALTDSTDEILEITPEFFEQVLVYVYAKQYHYAMSVNSTSIGLDKFLEYTVQLVHCLGDFSTAIYDEIDID